MHVQNGYSSEASKESYSDLPGTVVDPHQRLLIVLSNIGYCKDELASEMCNKYKHIWLQSRYLLSLSLLVFFSSARWLGYIYNIFSSLKGQLDNRFYVLCTFMEPLCGVDHNFKGKISMFFPHDLMWYFCSYFIYIDFLTNILLTKFWEAACVHLMI